MTGENASARHAAADAGRRNGSGSETVQLAPLRVRITSEGAAAFVNATGGSWEAGRVPLTFPACWLALPPVRNLLADVLGGGFLPIHEAQDFTYERELEAGREYILGVEACRTQAPPRLTLRMSIASLEEGICAQLEAVLRLVPTELGASIGASHV